ncbi:hypothetical protein ACFQGT_00490 [Natrialbaceae archaeon GCM10025810]
MLGLLERTAPVNLEGRRRLAFRWGLGYILFSILASAILFEVYGGAASVEQWQRAVAWLAFGTLVFLVIAANSYYQFDATEEREREHLRAIRPQLVNARPTKLTITRAEFRASMAGYHDRVAGLFDGHRPDDVPTVRDSLAEFRRAWDDRTRVLPGLATKLIYEAALILVMGAVVFLPVSWWSGGESMGFDIGLEGLTSGVWTLITAFPGAGIALQLALALSLAAGEVLYQHWLIVSLVLFTGAVALIWLDRVTAEDLDVTLYPDRRTTLGGLVLFVGAVYLAGAVVATVFGALLGVVDLSIVGDALGVLAAAFVAVVFGRDIVADLRARLVTRQQWPEENTHAVAAYLVCRKVFATLGFLCLPLLLAYAVTAIGSGRLFAVALELTRAPWHVKLPAAGVVLLALSLVWRNYPDLVTQLADATRRALSSQLVRGLMFSRGIPILGIVVGFALAWPFALESGVGTPAAILVGLVAGAIARVGTLAWQASKYRFVDFADRDRGRTEVVVEAFTVEDADGVPIYVARVDGHEMAHRDKDVLVSVVLKDVRERFESGETRPSFARYYFEEATQHGHVDIGVVGDELMGDIKTRIEASLRENDGALEVQKMDTEMKAEYAEAAYRKAVRNLESRGVVDRREGKYVLH